MSMGAEGSIFILFGIVFIALVFCSGLVFFLEHHNAMREKHHQLVLFRSRVKVWWLFALFLCLSFWLGEFGLLFFFALASFQCLREYMSMMKTRISDHHALIWCFYFFLPVNYVLLGLGWVAAFMVFIPVMAFLLLPVIAVFGKDSTQFLSRTAQMQWGLMICVYFLSYIPALYLSAFYISVTDYDDVGYRNAALMVFFFMIVQAGNVFEYAWNMLMPESKIGAGLLPEGKTVGGFLAGLLGAYGVGFLLYGLTPFSFWQLLIVVLMTFLAGFSGKMVLMAIKQSKEISNWSYRYGNVSGVGMLDLVDALCFAAPVFFYTYHFFKTT